MSEARSYIFHIAEHGFADADAARFRAAWEQLEAAYLERLALAYGPLERWRDRFRAAARETIALVESNPHEARFLVVDGFAAGELGRECQRRLSTRLAGLLDSAREELPEPDSVPPATAPWIAGLFFDRLYRHLTGVDGPGLAVQLPELMFLAVSAYFGTEAGISELFHGD